MADEPARAPEPGIVDGHGADVAHPPGPELRRLADALRTVTDQVVHTHATPALIAEAADVVERAAALLAPVTPDWVPSVPAWPGLEPGGDEFFPFSPMIGRYSPLSPPIEIEVVDGEIHGRGTLGAAYEGPPGCVHGGIIAGLFDEMLGVANIASGVGRDDRDAHGRVPEPDAALHGAHPARPHRRHRRPQGPHRRHAARG